MHQVYGNEKPYDSPLETDPRPSACQLRTVQQEHGINYKH